MLHINNYTKEHYLTLFNPNTGFFARVEDDGYPEPLWSQHGPELLDISITGWCDRNCTICYRNSSPNRNHMSLADYEKVICQAAAMGVNQVALGGGNPNQHPDFCEILKLTRNKYSIVPSYTNNGRGLLPDIIKASANFCGAVAVSAYSPYEELQSALEILINEGIKTNVHFVLDARSIETAIAWLRMPPAFLENVNAIIFLNYKPIGRQKNEGILLRDSQNLETFFELVQNAEFPFRIGFDSCMVSGLVSFTSINSSFYDACEAARFSMFISENMMMYPCSFMESISDGIFVLEDNILDAWQNSSLFRTFREKLLKNNCLDCFNRKTCLGGCPIFKDVNICSIG